MRIGDAGVAVAGARVVEPTEIAAYGGLAVGGERVDWMGNGPQLACGRIEDSADEVVVLAVVPEDFGCAAGNPLEHAALLPAPRFRAAELNPAVVVLEVHHADADFVVRLGLTVLEV